jgi:hypothetical protein
MFDSLHSPMDEAQRMARAARLLPPILTDKLKPIFEKIDKHVRKAERRMRTDPMEHNDNSAGAAIQDAIDRLSKTDQRRLLEELPGGAPDHVIEMYFCKRAFDKVAEIRPVVEDQLRIRGYTPDPTRPSGPDNYIKPEAITAMDVMNVVIRDHLSPFEQQMLRARKSLVNIRRYTASCDMPVMVPQEVETTDEEGNPATVTVDVQAVDDRGNPQYELESPVKPQRAQLMQGRSKAVPFEDTMSNIQEQVPVQTVYDFIPQNVNSLKTFSHLEPGAEPPVPRDEEVITIATGLGKKGRKKKLGKSHTFVANMLLWDDLLPRSPHFVLPSKTLIKKGS